MNNKRGYFESGGREGPGPSRGGVDPKLLIPTESQIDEFIETLKGPEGSGRRRGLEEHRNYHRPQDVVYHPYERSNSALENQRFRSRSRSRTPDMRRSPRRDRRPSPSDRRDSRRRSADRLNEPADEYQRSKYNEPAAMQMNPMGFVPQFSQGMMDPRMMPMNPLMTQQMMTQMMAMMPQMMGMMNPMMMQPFLAAAAAAQKVEAKPVEEPPPPPRIKEKSPPVIAKNEWKNSSRIPTPPPPPSLSECKKATEKVPPPKKKETDIISTLLENKDVSLSSLLEAAIEPKGSKRHIEDPVLKKKIVEQCEKRISQLYKQKNCDGAFIPDPISKDRTEELNMLFNHPYLEFSCESRPVNFWCSPNVKVPEKKPQVKIAPKVEEIKEKEENETFSIETIKREELIVPLNLPIQCHSSYLPPLFPSSVPSLDSLPPVPTVPPRTYDRPIGMPSRMAQPNTNIEISPEDLKKKKSKKKRKRRKRRRSRSTSPESDDPTSEPPKIVPPPVSVPNYQWNNPVPAPVPAPVPVPVPSPSVNPITHPWLKLDPVSKVPVKTPVVPPPNQIRPQNESNLVAIQENIPRPIHQPPVYQPINRPPMPVQNYGPMDYAPPGVDSMPPSNYIPPDTNFPPPYSNYPESNFNPHSSSFPAAHDFPSGSNFPPAGGPTFPPTGVPNFPPPSGPNFPPPAQNFVPVTYPPIRTQPVSIQSGANITVPISSAPSTLQLDALKKQFQKIFAPISKATEDLRTFQENDSTCSGIKARLLSGKSSLTDVFTLYDGLLCRIEDYNRNSKCIQIVVPKTSIYKAIVAIHNSNHFLKQTMFEEILYECFYSLGDVRDLISSVYKKCEFCEKPAPRSLSRERYQNEILSQRPGAIVLPKIKVNLKKKNSTEDRMDKNESPNSFQKFKNDPFHFYRKQMNKPKLYDDSETIDLTEQEKQESKMPNLDFKTRVRDTQMMNETLKNMINDLENDKPSDPSYILKGSMLCQKVTIDKNSVVRIVADLEHIRDFCYIVHTMASIHAPFEKSLTIFKKHFIPIDGIDAILKNVVDSCETCKEN